MTEYNEGLIPSDTLESMTREWSYEKVDSRTHQWSRPLDRDEIDWDISNVDLVGTDVPVRIVSLEYHEQWSIHGLETAGPDNHRPGFIETISSEYVTSADSLEEAVKIVREFVEQLS
ncbi:hypothetical protein C5B90_02975 [Haloferax sp. Atlit-12N]|uniref:hypothetical protein n=1 Tax=Haloferax sp. Atlit-12N TaxID=2077203 RepID=UPI000E23B795|nr:hypothetical protein [Haloferax sp. Atlit-12N]RDZ65344.1 hypothetical protein C5B90_02975 [Haloferax sp. Atlit-12N]